MPTCEYTSIIGMLWCSAKLMRQNKKKEENSAQSSILSIIRRENRNPKPWFIMLSISRTINSSSQTFTSPVTYQLWKRMGTKERKQAPSKTTQPPTAILNPSTTHVKISVCRETPRMLIILAPSTISARKSAKESMKNRANCNRKWFTNMTKVDSSKFINTLITTIRTLIAQTRTRGTLWI